MVSGKEISVKSKDDTNKPFNQLMDNGVDVDLDILSKEISKRCSVITLITLVT